MKWISEKTEFYPINDGTLKEFPKSGVFSLLKNSSGQLGLEFLKDNFEFNYKVYDSSDNIKFIDKVTNTWKSDLYKDKNLGIILNGPQGTGKTVVSQMICNKLNIPVIVINNCDIDVIRFIGSLDFECIILIDEAEKIFSDYRSDIILKLTEGKLNKTRKLYILIANRMDYLNRNLFNRPSRIRYIKEFSGLSLEFQENYIKDNIINKEKSKELLNYLKDKVDTVTIDVLKESVLECNLSNEVPDDCFNIIYKTFTNDCISFDINSEEEIGRVDAFIEAMKNSNLGFFSWINLPITELKDFFDENPELFGEYSDDISNWLRDEDPDILIEEYFHDFLCGVKFVFISRSSTSDIKVGDNSNNIGLVTKKIDDKKYIIKSKDDNKLKYVYILDGKRKNV